MSKMQIAIIDLLTTNDEWMSSEEIARAVGFKKTSTRVSLFSMFRNGLVMMKDDPKNVHGTLYRKSDQRSGFGVSSKMSQLDQCLQAVRQ